jgi:hypothetical protein
MEHYELHIINTRDDAELAEKVGLYATDTLTDLVCEHCEEPVAEYNGQFYPFALTIGEDDDEWITCEECFLPVVYPSTYEYVEDSDEYEEL